ncbi:MAG TPA: D-ribose pyranase [Candidatus Dorea intestinavium]|nr:D-ribose pyranase [Candidatus Dorea intestinavium]
MKKSGILNAKLAGLIAGLGHKEWFMIADCGMPIPKEVEIVDLSLCMGIPRFLDVLENVLKEVNVEYYVLAKEINDHNLPIKEKSLLILKGVNHECIDHEELKKFSSKAKFVIRTGEDTPFANIMLQSGVSF